MTADVLVPTSPSEAAGMFGSGDGVTVFAGGTILLPEIAAGRLKPQRALMLHKAGLDTIAVEGGRVVIGAMVPVSALVESDESLLAEAAAHLADNEVRRNATVGGNLCASAADDAQRGDLGGPLIALGAQVTSSGADGEKTEPVEDFLASDRAARLVLSVSYEQTERRSAGAGLRRRHAHSYSIATVAACLSGSDLRIAVTGVGPTAARCRSVEESRSPEDVLKDVTPVDDAVASAASRQAILPKLVREALDQLELA
jgi:aerobic carbon-monoxide dehydrogenase medium subunit